MRVWKERSVARKRKDKKQTPKAPTIRDRAGDVALASLVKIAAGRPVDPNAKPPTAGETLKAIERLRELGYGPAGPAQPEEKPKRKRRKSAQNAGESGSAHVAAPVLGLPLPEGDEWTELDRLVLRYRLGLPPAQGLDAVHVGKLVRPESTAPEKVVWRVIGKPYVKEYIRRFREWEVEQLGITRASIAASFNAVREASDPRQGRASKVVVVDGSLQETGQSDPQLLKEHRESSRELARFMALDKPERVEVRVNGGSFDDADAFLDGLLERVHGAGQADDSTK